MNKTFSRLRPISDLLITSHCRSYGTRSSTHDIFDSIQQTEVIDLKHGIQAITSSLDIDVEKRLSSISILSKATVLVNSEFDTKENDGSRLLQYLALTWKQSLQLLATASDAIAENSTLSSSSTFDIRNHLIDSKKHLRNEYDIFWTMVRQGQLVPDTEKDRVGVESCAAALRAKQVNDIQSKHIYLLSKFQKEVRLRRHSFLPKVLVPSSIAYSLAKKSMMHLVVLRDVQSLKATWSFILNGVTKNVKRDRRVMGMNHYHLNKFLVDITEALIDLVCTPRVCKSPPQLRNDLQHTTIHRLAHRSYFTNQPDDLSLSLFVQCLKVIPVEDLESIECLRKLWSKKWNPPHAFDNTPNLPKLENAITKTEGVRTLHVFGLVDKNSHVLLPANLRVKLFSSAHDVALTGTSSNIRANSIWVMNTTQLKLIYVSFIKNCDVLSSYNSKLFGINFPRNEPHNDVLAYGTGTALLAAYLARDTVAVKEIIRISGANRTTLMKHLVEMSASVALNGKLVHQEKLLRRIFRREYRDREQRFFKASGISPLETSEAIHLGFAIGTIHRRNNNKSSKKQKYPWDRNVVKRHLLATMRHLSNHIGSINSVASILNLAVCTSHASGVLFNLKPNLMSADPTENGNISSLLSVPWAGDKDIFNVVLQASSTFLTAEALDRVTQTETEALGLVSKAVRMQWMTPVSKVQRSVFCPDHPFALVNVRTKGFKSVRGFVMDILLTDKVVESVTGYKRYPYLNDSQRVALMADCFNAGMRFENVKAGVFARYNRKDSSNVNEAAPLPNRWLLLSMQLISRDAYERKVGSIKDPVTMKVFEALKVTSRNGLVALQNILKMLSSTPLKEDSESNICDGKRGEILNNVSSFSDVRSLGSSIVRAFLGGPECALVFRRQMIKFTDPTFNEAHICLHQQERYTAEVRLRRESLIGLASNSTSDRELMMYMSTLSEFDRDQYNRCLQSTCDDQKSVCSNSAEFHKSLVPNNGITKGERLLICEGLLTKRMGVVSNSHM